ncbi:hypothetical protein D9M70_364970 [compost metagenome]
MQDIPQCQAGDAVRGVEPSAPIDGVIARLSRGAIGEAEHCVGNSTVVGAQFIERHRTLLPWGTSCTGIGQHPTVSWIGESSRSSAKLDFLAIGDRAPETD